MADPVRGEVWRVDFEPTQGSETGKERPAVVIGDKKLGRLPVRIVVPITGWDERYRAHLWMTELTPDGRSGLTKPSAADALQICLLGPFPGSTRRTTDLNRGRDRQQHCSLYSRP